MLPRTRPRRLSQLAALVALVACGGAAATVVGAGADGGATGDAGAIVPPPGPDDAGEAADGGDVGRAVETGLYVTVKVANLSKPYAAHDGTLYRLLSRSYVHGISLQIGWGDLEPTPGTYAPLLTEVLPALREVIAALGKPVTVKVHLRNGLVPDWLVPAKLGDGGAAVVFATSLDRPDLRFRALATPDKGSYDLTLVPTEPGYAARVTANVAEIARQLDAADPDASLVTIVQLAGPSSESGGTIRLSPREGFPRSGAADAYGFGWTFPAHLAAWKAMAALHASYPAYQRRDWSFDVTHEAPKPGNDTVFGLTTADQMAITDALVATHGAAHVRLMNEGASGQANAPKFPARPTKCDWTVGNFEDPVAYPEATLAAWPRHEYQVQSRSDDSDNFPRTELARTLLFRDPAAPTPALLQGTEFVELHDTAVLDDATPLLDGTDPVAAFTCLDRMVRKYAVKGATLSTADQAYWAAHPSQATMPCDGSAPYADAATTCIEP